MTASRADLPLWVVYDHPKDFPDRYVARQHVVGIAGQQPTDRVMTHADIESIRTALANLGLVRLDRHPADDPVILEVWL